MEKPKQRNTLSGGESYQLLRLLDTPEMRAMMEAHSDNDVLESIKDKLPFRLVISNITTARISLGIKKREAYARQNGSQVPAGDLKALEELVAEQEKRILRCENLISHFKDSHQQALDRIKNLEQKPRGIFTA